MTTTTTPPATEPNPASPLNSVNRTRRLSTDEHAQLLAEASNPDTPPERLNRMTRISPHVALAVAANPASPTATLDRLAESGRRSVRAAVAANPNASFHALSRCITCNPIGFLNNPALAFMLLEQPNLLGELSSSSQAAIVTHPDCPRSILDPIIELTLRDRDSRRGGLLLSRADLTREQARKLAESMPLPFRAASAPHVSSSPKSVADPFRGCIPSSGRVGGVMAAPSTLKMLSHGRPLDPRMLRAILAVAAPEVRRAIASNPSTPPDVLAELEADSNVHVVVALHANTSTPQSTRHRIAVQATRMRLLFSGESTPSHLAELAGHPRLEVRIAVALHPQAPSLACQALAGSRSLVLRRLAAAHPNTPEVSLLRLIEDARWMPIELESVRTDSMQYRLSEVIGAPASTTLMALHSLIELHERRAMAGGVHPEDSLGNRALITHAEVPGPLPERVIRTAPVFALVNYACFHRAHPTLLELIARHHTDLELLQRVGEHPNTPVRVLAELVRHQSAQVRRGAAGNPNLPEPCARALLRDPECSDRAALHPCFSLEERRRLDPIFADFHHAVVHHPQHRRLLAVIMHPQIATLEVAQATDLSASALELLASRPGNSKELMTAIARHRNAGPELLRRMAAQPCMTVLPEVARNESAPADLLMDILGRKGVPRRIKDLAVVNAALPTPLKPETERHLMAAWLRDYRTCPFWPVMLSHPACPEPWLARHARSHEWQNRLMVALNPNTPEDLLRRLAGDGIVSIRQTARQNLNGRTSATANEPKNAAL